jgi:acyl-CoA thioesterase-1
MLTTNSAKIGSGQIGPGKTASANSARVCLYGWRRAFYQITMLCSLLFVAATMAQVGAQVEAQVGAKVSAGETPIRIVVLGDSLTAGYGLPAADGFVPRLQTAMAAQSANVEIASAGVSGDTAGDGLARLDWSVPTGTDAAIIELGANDMLRGIDPQVTREALDSILARLAQRHIVVMLCGMKAAPNLGADYGRSFERIYPELAAKYGVLLYPFFLDGVAADLKLLQPDGLHPNASGVGVMVRRILPKVEELIARARVQKHS